MKQEFCVDDRVLYVPDHAKGNVAHPDCERGVVTSVRRTYVFVRYGDSLHPQATDPKNLRRRVSCDN